MDRSNTSQSPARRSDAERDREQILKVARAAFADGEADVSMAEIARQAGVGSATLYRNFANRRELLEALYVGEIDAVSDAAKTIEASSPGAAFEAWLRRFYTYFTSKQVVASELLARSGPDDPVFGAGYARVISAGRPLLDAARKSGEIQGDLTIEQILDMLVAIAKIASDAAYRAPILQAALDAIRTPTG